MGVMILDIEKTKRLHLKDLTFNSRFITIVKNYLFMKFFLKKEKSYIPPNNFFYIGYYIVKCL